MASALSPTQTWRSWVCVCADAGALPLKKIISYFYPDVLIVVDLGHWEMALFRLGMLLISSVLGVEFAHAHGFKEGTGGPNHLFGCGDNHYAFVFIWLVYNALCTELAKQFLIATPNESDQTAEAFLKWCDDAEGDLQFENIVFLVRVLSAIILARKALRDEEHNGKGNGFAIDAVIKFVLPLFYAFGFKKYGPLMAWDQARYFRVTPEIKKALREHLRVFQGQGMDFLQEQNIKLMKQFVSTRRSRGSIDALRKASVTQALSKMETDGIRADVGVRGKADLGGSTRTELDYTPDKNAMDLIFRKYDSVKKVPGRTTVTSVDTRKIWIQDVRLREVYDKGRESMINSLKDEFKTPVPPTTQLVVDPDAAVTSRRGRSIDSFEEEDDQEEDEQGEDS